MSTGYQRYDRHSVYFVTFTIVEWVDLFSRKTYRDIVTESLSYCCREKGLEGYGYIMMTNPVHLLLKAAGSNHLYNPISEKGTLTALGL